MASFYSQTLGSGERGVTMVDFLFGMAVAALIPTGGMETLF
jgi:Tfp pilus assembly protein FimT